MPSQHDSVTAVRAVVKHCGTGLYSQTSKCVALDVRADLRLEESFAVHSLSGVAAHCVPTSCTTLCRDGRVWL